MPDGSHHPDGQSHQICGEGESGEYHFFARQLSFSEDEAVYETISEPPHRVVVHPRAVGDKLGKDSLDPQAWGPGTVCTFRFDDGRFGHGIFLKWPNGSLVLVVYY
jgi:hypothetical protein